MSTKTESSVAEMEAELGRCEMKLWPLYAAQEAAQVDFNKAEAAQHSASGAHLTDMVLAARKYKAEVEKFTDQIGPFKSRAEALTRDIAAAKWAVQIAQIKTHARIAQDIAPQIATALDALRSSIASFVAQLNAMDNRDIKAELRALARYVEVQLHEAGLPDYRREGTQFNGVGTSPADVAEIASAYAATLR
jgi:molecular chaperone GrpE (heat shock protein)